MRASPDLARGVWTPGSLFNRTRTSPSISRRLLGEGKLHLLPLYALIRTSDMAREGIENSGSYRFADHVYRGRPEGRLGIGRLVDGALLRLRATRSLRNRFFHSRAEILAAALRHRPDMPFRVLSVPCGISRELVEAAETLRALGPNLDRQAAFFGIDLDPEPLAISMRLAGGRADFHFIRADALDSRAYPLDLDVIVSTGFAEFLTDSELVRFYAICRASLRDGGTFVTSATRRDRVSDFLMRELAELKAHYREPDEVVGLLRRAGFREISARLDDVGLQTLLVAGHARETTNARGGES